LSLLQDLKVLPATTATTSVSGVGAQPLLGMYPSMGSYVTAEAPDRLQPESRF